MWQYNSFYDDPKNVLMHHGILGQKWGVRRFQNADGSLTPAGRERYRKQNSDLSNLSNKIHTYDDKTTPQTIIRDIGKITKNSKLTNELTKITKQYDEEKKSIASEFDKLVNFKNDDEKEFYEASSEIIEAMSRYGIKEENMNDIAWHIYLGVYEDGQQGAINAYSLKAYDNGVTNKIKELDKQENNAYMESKELIKKTLLKECPDLDEQTAKRIAGQINESNNWSKTEASLYRLHEASRGDNIEKLKEQTKFAKNVCNNLKDCQSNWDVLNFVIEKLGYNDKMPDELTASDWKRINIAANDYYSK